MPSLHKQNRIKEKSLPGLGHCRALCELMFVVIFLGSNAGATEMTDFYNGVRSWGMGGAYVATVNDETSLLSNPAGLGRVRDVILTVADAEISAGSNVTTVASSGNLNFLTPSDLLGVLNKQKGKHWHTKAQIFPSFVAPNVGFGVHAKYKYDAKVNELGTIYRLDYTNDYAAAIGFCFRFFSGIVKLGGAARYVNRVEIHKDLDATQSSINMDQTASEGGGLAADVGLLLTAPVVLLPTLGIVVRDAGRTMYNMSSGMFLKTQTRPADTPQTIDMGLSFQPILGNHSRMTLTVDYHDALNAANEQDGSKRIHVGTEFNIADFFFFRVGMNQRYWTAGLELSGPSFQMQFASYGEEIGTVAATKEDRRYVAKIAFRL